jgi:nicotinamidase-related amidase
MSTDDLHGNAPDQSPVALLLVDVINDLEFEGGEDLLPHAVEAARRIRDLKTAAKELGIPAIYANDNFGRWRSDFREVVEHNLQDGVRGEELARLLAPEKDDYFVLKPKHSAFFATTLETLLQYLGAQRLILVGYSSDICVTLTAADAYMRDYRLWVPADCVASASPKENRHALAYMQRVLEADTTPSDRLDLRRLLA